MLTIIHYNSCRCCKSQNLKSWLTLPDSPVANALYSIPKFLKFPLTLIYCLDCGHLQLANAPDPNDTFSDYRYKSSVSGFFRKHFESYAKNISERYLSPASSVLEIGSNDGYLLSQFKSLGHKTYGVEPSKHIADCYEHSTLYNSFFSSELVQTYNLENKFDIICANNVLAHIPNTQDVIKAISTSLKENGILVAECGDQKSIFSGECLDNVYHEHIDYYSPYSFSKLLSFAGLSVESVESINSHGMSFRLVARKTSKLNILERISIDLDSALNNVKTLISKRETRIKKLLNKRPFIAYGAAAKAVTSLYTLNLVDENLIDVVDDNDLKQGYYFPGTALKIKSPAEIDKNSLILVTAWNVFEDIKAKLLSRGHTGEVICM